jgi:non-heme chloroperoxidase
MQMRATLLVGAVLILLTIAAGSQIKQTSAFFTTSDSVRIHYLDAGSGRPIVFIPGWTMPAWIWQEQIDEFSKNYRVIAVDPRSQGESDKPSFGHLPETRSRDYKELIDHLNLQQPVLVGWSMACGELLKFVEQFGTKNLAGLVLVDGLLWDKQNPDMFVALSGWMNQLQQDRQKQADGFVRSMFKEPHPESYYNRLADAAMQVPADTAAVLIYDMLAVKEFSTALAKLNRPVLFAYQPETQSTADMLKAKLGDRVRLERFENDGHALFVDDAERFNHVLDDFLRSLTH